MSIATVVLAAGGSTRMGTPKQLLEFKGETLVRRAVRVATESRLGPVLVVVGSDRAAVESAIAGLGAVTVPNDRWEEGMGTSLARGVERAESDPAVEAALITLADQPMVDSAILARLVAAWRNSGNDAAACLYGSTRGVPAVFSRALFPRLRALPASGGAKHILADAALRLSTIDFPEGLADIDTPDDYQRLVQGPPWREA